LSNHALVHALKQLNVFVPLVFCVVYEVIGSLGICYGKHIGAVHPMLYQYSQQRTGVLYEHLPYENLNRLMRLKAAVKLRPRYVLRPLKLASVFGYERCISELSYEECVLQLAAQLGFYGFDDHFGISLCLPHSRRRED
jgi:hypothetical protein